MHLTFEQQVSVELPKALDEIVPLIGYFVEMEQKNSEDPKGKRHAAASWIQVSPTASAWTEAAAYHSKEKFADYIQKTAIEYNNPVKMNMFVFRKNEKYGEVLQLRSVP